MTHQPWFRRLLALGTVGAALTATAISLQPASAAVVFSSRPTTLVSPDVKGGCHAQGGVRVTPCNIAFTASNPGPDLVTVRTPGGGGTLSYLGDCARNGVATVTPQGNNQFLVTAGTTTGGCRVFFIYMNQQGKTIGTARLNVINQL